MIGLKYCQGSMTLTEIMTMVDTGPPWLLRLHVLDSSIYAWTIFCHVCVDEGIYLNLRGINRGGGEGIIPGSSSVAFYLPSDS